MENVNSSDSIDDGNLTFEKALEELEKAVETMENEKISLDDLMKNFERGKKLADFCGGKLATLERKIEILVNGAPEGGEWAPFGDQPRPRPMEENADGFELE